MSLRNRLVAAFAATAMSAAGLLFVQTEEDVVYTAYPDAAHGWAVPTICSGHTEGVKRGDTATESQCLEYLREDTAVATKGVLRCTRVPLRQHELDALGSFAFNVGVYGYCSSTMARKLNAGDRTGAAEQFTRWVYANKRDCRIRSNNCYGVVTRRSHEHLLFTQGIYRPTP